MIREEIILKEIEGKRVLDIGSVGQTSKYCLWDLYKNISVKSLTGIDLPSSHEINKKFCFSSEVDKLENKIVYGNMENFVFEEKFDVIIAGDVIEHVSNQGLFLDNIFKYLNNDGKLIITTPNSKWITGYLRPNPTHTLWHDKHTLKRILDVHNFKIKVFKYYYGNKRSYSFFARLILLRQCILVVCEKSE